MNLTLAFLIIWFICFIMLFLALLIWPALLIWKKARDSYERQSRASEKVAAEDLIKQIESMFWDANISDGTMLMQQREANMLKAKAQIEGIKWQEPKASLWSYGGEKLVWMQDSEVNDEKRPDHRLMRIEFSPDNLPPTFRFNKKLIDHPAFSLSANWVFV